MGNNARRKRWREHDIKRSSARNRWLCATNSRIGKVTALLEGLCVFDSVVCLGRNSNNRSVHDSKGFLCPNIGRLFFDDVVLPEVHALVTSYNPNARISVECTHQTDCIFHGKFEVTWEPDYLDEKGRKDFWRDYNECTYNGRD